MVRPAHWAKGACGEWPYMDCGPVGRPSVRLRARTRCRAARRHNQRPERQRIGRTSYP